LLRGNILPKKEKAVSKRSSKSFFKPRKINYRHYFGGGALLLIIMQLLTGLYMIFYYEPSLKDTYKTVQFFNNEALLGSLTRNMHRYGAFFIAVAMIVHMGRGYFRRDFQGGRFWNWMTGMTLFLVLAGFLISGTILPWEWKGYWMMEMFNNSLREVPIIGDWLYTFFMTSYTPTRNFVIHDIILPLITFIVLEIHCLSRLKKRGFGAYLAGQFVAVIPLIIAVIAFSLLYPVPTGDPEIIPLPMEGKYIPAPEWFFVSYLLPYWYASPRHIQFFIFWVPFLLFLYLLSLPFIYKKKSKKERENEPKKKMLYIKLAYFSMGAVIFATLTAGVTFGSAKAPWMGCNSCHNRAMGARMGIPPVTYKDTERNPLVLDKRWMIRHWYEPQVVW